MARHSGTAGKSNFRFDPPLALPVPVLAPRPLIVRQEAVAVRPAFIPQIAAPDSSAYLTQASFVVTQLGSVSFAAPLPRQAAVTVKITTYCGALEQVS